MDLSILIPARNEEFLAQTVNNILENIEADTEIIVALDGEWSDPPLLVHERLKVLYFPESIGQRAATNECAKISNAKYVMKVDAHCAFDKGFDRKLIKHMQDDWTVTPMMYNLHAFDWKCNKCGNRWYQGPEPTVCVADERRGTDACVNTKDFQKEIVWKPRQFGPTKKGPTSTAYRVNPQLEFQYFPEYRRKQVGVVVESMSLQGSCFMMNREKYWELSICDEEWGSWGGQGAEVALKTWTSGGKVKIVTSTWYAHLFRTQKGFGFPYPNPAKYQKKAKDTLRETFLKNKWEKQKLPLSWLVKKFWPVPEWTEKDLQDLEKADKPPLYDASLDILEIKPSKEIIYYTDNKVSIKIGKKVRKQLLKSGVPIVSVSLKPLENFGRNYFLPLERGYLTMAKQILTGLENSEADIVYFCEHDVLYHPSHFEFIPEEKDVCYYNTNVWRVRYSDGHAYRVDDCKQLSGLCAYRETMIEHFKKRVERLTELERQGELTTNNVLKIGFEPGTHHRPEKIDDLTAKSYESQYPNLDIRHDNNLTPSRWSPDQFRNKKNTEGWKESDEIPGWGVVAHRMGEIIAAI